MTISALAKELNDQIKNVNPVIYDLLSSQGKRLFFPKGILTQSREAQELAHQFNATIGIATKHKQAMHLATVRQFISDQFSIEEVFPYAPSSGVMKLRHEWQNRQRQLNTSITQSSLPVVTNALTHGLSLIGDLFIEKDDLIILPDKFWGNYRLMWEINKQATFKFYETFTNDLSGFNTSALAKSLLTNNLKKAILVLNFPNNPTGYTVKKSEASIIKEIIYTCALKGTKLLVICDDAYAGLNYESHCESESFFGDLANCHENILAVKVDGCTKEHFMWGFRIGFITFGSKNSEPLYKALEKKVSGAIRGNISNTNHYGQTLLLKALQRPSLQEEIQNQKKMLKTRYDRVKSEVTHSKYSHLWDYYPFNSGYFMCLRLKTIAAEKLRVYLLKNYGIGTINAGEKDLRIAFSCLDEENIQPLFQSIAKAISEIS